jgi:hypothetical protein
MFVNCKRELLNTVQWELDGLGVEASASKGRSTQFNSHRREYFSESVGISHDP